MKKQLALTALAIAMAAPGVATATEVKVGGILQIFYFADHEDDADENIGGADVRTQITASETVGGYTGYSSFRIDADSLSNGNKGGSSSTTTLTDSNGDTVDVTDSTDGTGLTADSITVGVKNDSFDFQMGEVSKVQDLGRYAGDIRKFQGDLESHIGITGSFGPVKVRAAYSPEANLDYTGLGLEYNAGIVSVGVNTQSRGDDDATTFGVKGSVGPVALAAHYTDGEIGGVDGEITAIKASGKAGIASLALTHHMSDELGDKTRFDASVPVAGIVSAVLRYETEELNDEGFTRIGLQSKF